MDPLHLRQCEKVNLILVILLWLQMQADIVPAIRYLQGTHIYIIHQFNWNALRKIQSIIIITVVMLLFFFSLS